MQHTLTWLHLSDLHACQRMGWDRKQVNTTLEEDLERLRAQEPERMLENELRVGL